MSKNKWVVQLAVVLALIALPVIMIFYNGRQAVEGIMWEDTKEANPDNSVSEETPAQSRRDKPLGFGVYDPESHFGQDSIFQFEQIYISWVNYNKGQLLEKLTNLKKRGIQPILTVEPWPLHPDEKNLLSSIIVGDYDKILQQISEVLNTVDGKVSISWGHEMDQDLTVRYPWSNSNPEEFIKAYRYVVDYLEKKVSPDIEWIWTPVVKSGSDRYWPGSEYVDKVGMPIYSFPEWDQSYYGYIRDFTTTYNEKYKLVSSFDKPVVIMEMGVTGNLDYQSFWLRMAMLEMMKTTNLETVVFFYSRDTPGAWGKNLSTPDWRINKDILRAMVDWARKNG